MISINRMRTTSLYRKSNRHPQTRRHLLPYAKTNFSLAMMLYLVLKSPGTRSRRESKNGVWQIHRVFGNRILSRRDSQEAGSERKIQ